MAQPFNRLCSGPAYSRSLTFNPSNWLALLRPFAAKWKNLVLASPSCNYICLDRCLQSISRLWSSFATTPLHLLRSHASSSSVLMSSRSSTCFIHVKVSLLLLFLSSCICFRNHSRCCWSPMVLPASVSI